MAKQSMKDLHDLDEFRGVIFKEGARGKGFADVLTATLNVESMQDKKGLHDLDEFRGARTSRRTRAARTSRMSSSLGAAWRGRAPGRVHPGGRARQGLRGCPHGKARRGGLARPG